MENRNCKYCSKVYSPKTGIQKICGDFLCKVALKEESMSNSKTKAKARKAIAVKNTGSVSRCSIYEDDRTFT